MKFRLDFVSNSSSSSFICVAKIDVCQELIDFIREEYGKFGANILENNLVSGKELKNGYDGEDYEDFFDGTDVELDDDAMYLVGTFIAYTTDGDQNDDDAWLLERIPKKFKEEVFESEAY